MKRVKGLVWVILFVSLFFVKPSYCQSFEAQQLILDWQKLSTLKQILQDMKDGYQIIEKGYTTIRDISQGSFSLHKVFLDGLLSVSPLVKKYQRIADIVSLQIQIVSEYKSALARFKQDSHFTPDEISLMATFYGNLFNKSLSTLNALINVITDGQLRASDDERIHQIDGLYNEMKLSMTTLRNFNNTTEVLSLQRTQDNYDYEMVKKLYGITN